LGTPTQSPLREAGESSDSDVIVVAPARARVAKVWVYLRSAI